MAKFKLLVVGDSFALLDQKHGHWAKIWAQSQGGTTEHIAWGGASHVQIVSHVLGQDIDWRSISGVLYFVTDFFRMEAVNDDMIPPGLGPDLLKHVSQRGIDMLLYMNNWKDPNYDESWRTVLDGNHTSPESWPQTFKLCGALPVDYGTLKPTTALYDNISLRWVARANFNSFKLFARTVKLIHKTPVYAITTAWDQGNHLFEEYIPELSGVWTQNLADDGTRHDIDYAGAASANHVLVDDAVNMAKRFNRQVYAKDLFKLVRTSE